MIHFLPKEKSLLKSAFAITIFSKMCYFCTSDISTMALHNLAAKEPHVVAQDSDPCARLMLS